MATEEEKPKTVRMPRRRRPQAEDEEPVVDAEVVEEEEQGEQAEAAPRRRRRRPAPEAEEQPELPTEEEEQEEEPTPPPAKKRRRRTKAEMEADTADEEEEEQGGEEEPPAKRPRAKKKAAAKRVSTSKAVSTTRNTGPVVGMESDADADELEMPTFKLLHQMSDDAEEMPDSVGRFVYNKEIDMGTALVILIVNYKKMYREVCDWDPAAPPEEFETKKEAQKAGVKVKPFAVIDILIPLDQEGLEEYEEEATMFIDEVPYVAARWYVTSGFRKVASPLRMHLNKGMDCTTYDRFYEIHVQKLPGKGRRRAAVLRPSTELTNEDTRSAVASMRGDE